MPLDWSRLFPSGEYGFHMGLRTGDARAFFAATDARAELLAERGRWLDVDAEKYAAMLPEGAELVAEGTELAVDWGMPAAAVDVVALGRMWEPDFVLLRAGEEGVFR